MTTAPWHLIWNASSGATILYDNTMDPGGMRNVASAHPELVRTLMARLRQYHSRHQEARRLTVALRKARTGAADIEPKYLEQLRALGYLEDRAP